VKIYLGQIGSVSACVYATCLSVGSGSRSRISCRGVRGQGQGQGLSQCGLSGECLKGSCHEDTCVNCESGS
jgi:hypothetical protein